MIFYLLFQCFTLCGEMPSGVHLIHALPINFRGNNNLRNIKHQRMCTYCARSGGKRSVVKGKKMSDKLRHINAYQIEKKMHYTDGETMGVETLWPSCTPSHSSIWAQTDTKLTQAALAPMNIACLINFLHMQCVLLISEDKSRAAALRRNNTPQKKAFCIHEIGFNSPCRYNNEVPLPRLEWTVMIMIKQNCWVFFSILPAAVSKEL